MPKNKNPEKVLSGIETAAKELFDYAIDREEVKWLIAHLPEEAAVKRATVEYELHILKIVTVGWSISYHLNDDPVKSPLLELFWQAMYSFSNDLTETTKLMTGHDPDYFKTLKSRLDQYVQALSHAPEGTEPVVIIGPAFASICGNEQDIFTSLTGSKMFSTVVANIQSYLQARPWQTAEAQSIH